MPISDEATQNQGVDPSVAHAKLALMLVGLLGAVLVFVFLVLVPLYTLLCNRGGVQPNPNNEAVIVGDGTATGRYLDVFFESKVFDDLPVRFYAEQERQRVEVGQDAKNTYRFQNLSDRTVHFRPIHQVSPAQAAAHFGMKVCFCFNDQEIEPGGEREFPVVYRFGTETDARVVDVTIRYSILALVAGESADESQERVERATGGEGIVTPRFKDAPAAVEGSP